MPKPEKIKIDCDNLHSKRGARLLAEVIGEYWLNRGYLVLVEGYRIDPMHWGVRSNMVNGLPPGLRR